MLKHVFVPALGAAAIWIGLGRAQTGAVQAARPAADAAKRVEIVVERQKAGRVEAMDPNHVFDSGELVRFRFRASFNGYLYVMNHSTSGQYVLLFPKEETGRQNRIEAGREYLVPMTESGWFRLEGPPGHEVVYWLVSPVKLSESDSGRPVVAKLPAPARPLNPSITPRCDDAIFRARGECIDNSAGLKALKKDTPLPENLLKYDSIKARDLTMVKTSKAAAVSAADQTDEPFIYTLRLAHR
ncbi:MAG: DUF4384 domain-containing protein [Acidobacteria bacterium]|nr:DUF4384 domain-containing protein [Acidobacteriota bacterium]